MRENCIIVLMGVARRLLGPHDTLPCVLIHIKNSYIYLHGTSTDEITATGTLPPCPTNKAKPIIIQCIKC